ncbi:MAG: hypothetical protein U0470_01050 [Anaerolineae bacterium]
MAALAGIDPQADERAALARLRLLGVPSLSIVQDTTPRRVGANVPRPGESARVVLPASLAAADLIGQLAPALFPRRACRRTTGARRRRAAAARPAARGHRLADRLRPPAPTRCTRRRRAWPSGCRQGTCR